MSIKKCIMNYFDKATNAMIPFHPQTESGAITDWHESIIGSLASKVLPTVVSELTTDSVLGKLMKMLLSASGVKYSIDTNGYVCLGSFFGGLIIQWGKQQAGNDWICAFPIAYPHNLLCVVPIDFAATDDGFQYVGINEKDSSLSGFKLMTSNKKDIGIAWISAGY